jgi:hypothetical protein
MKLEESDIYSIQVRLEQNEDLSIIVASGPYMINGSVNTSSLNSLIEAVKAQNVPLLVLVMFIHIITQVSITFLNYWKKCLNSLKMTEIYENK